MKILAVAPYVPHEGMSHAGGEYLLRHLQALNAHGHRIRLIVPGTPEQRANVPLAPAWLEVSVGTNVPEGRSSLRRVGDALYRRAMNCPPSPAAEILRSISAKLLVLAPQADLIELHWADYARFASVLRKAGVTKPISVVEHDVGLGAAVRRLRDYGTGYRRVLGLLTAPLRWHMEQRGLSHADVVLVFKRADEDVLRRSRIDTPVIVIDPWLDAPAEQSVSRRPQSVLFTGALWRPENEEGILWFLERVWPQVRLALSDATMTIVGAAPRPALLQATARAAGVELVADVPDMLPYYRAASLFVAPLFVEGGLKFKIPQAMLCGLPVVATPRAAEGIIDVAPPDVFWAITDTPDDMAASVITALTDPARASEVGVAAAEWSAGHYSFCGSIMRILEEYTMLTKPI